MRNWLVRTPHSRRKERGEGGGMTEIMAVRRRGNAFALSLIVLVSLGAVAAASASALTWFSKSGATETGFTLGQEETTTPAAKTGTVFTFLGTLGTTPVKLESKKLTGEATKIKQEGTTAKDSGKLVFGGLTLVEPTGCTVPTSITTSPLKSELVEAPGLTSGLADRFLPESGEVFVKFVLGGTCLNTTIQFVTQKGVFAEVEQKGVSKLEQPLRFSAAINSTAGGSLATGGNVATLTGEAGAKLSGSLLGKEWGVK